LVFFQTIGPFCGKDLDFKGLEFTCKKTGEDVVQLESIQAEVQWPVFTLLMQQQSTQMSQQQFETESVEL
jgi:hypothetical protein